MEPAQILINMLTPVIYHNCLQCAYKTTSSFQIDNHMMSHNLSKQERLFSCTNPLETLKCFKCVNFETHKLVDLKQHFKGCHTLAKDKYERFTRSENDFNNIKYNYPYQPQSRSILKDYLTKKDKPNKTKSFKCEHCPYAARRRAGLNQHIFAKHTDSNEIQWFKCEQCAYKSKTKFNLKEHMAYKHGGRKFECVQCQFETRYNEALKVHVMMTHTDPDQIQWFQCEHCTFKTIRKCNMRKHVQNKHTDPDKIRWFRCEHCPYQTKEKGDLKKHANFMHSGSENLKKCAHCEFVTKSKHILKQHTLRKHADPAVGEWFQCAQCWYKARLKTDLKKHVARHQNK